jgi:hypothetical protein
MIYETFESTDFEKLNTEVEKYFYYYNPCGYNTRIDRTEYFHKDGKLYKRVKISRYSSCD